jgi:2-polyprenyl-3-methyl-5-hydroxy-6-metoxy-1,4-benzoquinol methylase
MYATLRCMDDYRDVNLASWDERAAAHAASPDYAVSRFIDDPSFLSEVVSFDLPRLGDIAGLDAVHLQCHIGTDTVSLARLGARMTGLDFSPAALEQGRRLAATVGLAVEFVKSVLYIAP